MYVGAYETSSQWILFSKMRFIIISYLETPEQWRLSFSKILKLIPTAIKTETFSFENDYEDPW